MAEHVRYSEITINENGSFEGQRYSTASGSIGFTASFDLFLIRQAWDDGVDYEDLADGYGEGMGTMGYDWSGIRDSSPGARARMFERALNHFFGRRR